MRKLGFCIGVALMALAVSAPPALAGDTRCAGPLTGVHDNVVVPERAVCIMNGATVKGNVKALPASTLQISSSVIGGNVEGDKPEALALSRVTPLFPPNVVGGNVTVIGAGAGFPFQVPGGPLVHVSVAVCDTTLPDGNVSIEKSSGGTVAVGSPIIECGANTLKKGNIFLQQNVVSEFLVVTGNAVRKGNIFLQENVVSLPSSVLLVSDNAVGGNGQVFKNRGPGAKSVSGNTVREDLQCKENDPPFVGGPNAARKAEGQCGGAPGG